MKTLLARYDAIQKRVMKAAEKAGHEVTLMVVSKAATPDQIKALLDHGVDCFGESRLQAIESKWISTDLASDEVALHFIGPLQSNKLPAIATHCHGLHSLSQVRHLALLSSLDKRPEDIFCQVNIGHEAQKSGVLPADLCAFLKQADAAEVHIKGLMCIPPQGQDSMPYFMQMKELAQGNGLYELNMGMSHDFESAIANGATWVRVGSAIFTPQLTLDELTD